MNSNLYKIKANENPDKECPKYNDPVLLEKAIIYLKSRID
jgi:hypothetical protein